MIHPLDFILVLAMAAVTFFTRALPFLFFKNKSAPPLVRFLQSYIPPMMMLILVVYSVKDLAWTELSQAVPAGVGILLSACLQIVLKNALVSIFGGTAVYMLLLEVM